MKEKIAEIAKPRSEERKLIRDLIPSGSVVVLVTPIDESAPKGRIILPQVQTIRDLLDGHAITVVCQPDELPAFEEFLVENAQALSRAGVNFERLRGFVGDPQRAARLNREIDAYLAERSVQPLTPTTS